MLNTLLYNFIEWILTTKLGRFIFIIFFDLVIFSLLALFFEYFRHTFWYLWAGGIIAAIPLSIFNKDNWIKKGTL